MKTSGEKQPSPLSLAAAHTPTPSKQRTAPTMRIPDHRSETITQRHIIQLADHYSAARTPQVIQLAGDRDRLLPSDRNTPYSQDRFMDWLEDKARAEGKMGLIGVFNGLHAARKMAVLQNWNDISGSNSMKQAKSRATNWIGWVKWEEFSNAVQQAKRWNMPAFQNYNADRAVDYGNYAATGLGDVASTPQDTVLGLNSAAEHIGSWIHRDLGTPISPDASGLTQIEIANVAGLPLGMAGNAVGAYQNIDRARSGSTAERTILGTRAAHQITGIGRQAASGTMGLSNLGVSGISTAAATAAGGVFGVASGTASLVSGVTGTIVHHRRARQLDAHADTTTDLGRAATLAASTQRLNRNLSIGNAVKGAALIAGGALLLASNPIGWALMGAGALIGGIAIAVKFFKKRARRKKKVDELLCLGSSSAALRNNPRDLTDEERDPMLLSEGFVSVEQYYAWWVADMARTLNEQAAAPYYNNRAWDILEAMGLRTDPNRMNPPEINVIARQLHT